MKKTWIALLLVAVLALALAIPALATEHADGSPGHCVCAGTDSSCDHSESLTWQAWSGGSITTSGNYYLTQDLGDDETLAQTMIGTNGSTTPITVNLCLNGHNMTASGRVLLVWGNVTLNISNCKTATGGNITGIGFDSTNCGTMLIQTGATASLYDGVHLAVSGSRTITRAGCVELNGTLHMYGGSITGGTVTGVGGAMQINGKGKLYLHDGTITGGYATTGGVIRAESGAQIVMTGGTIHGGNPSNRNAVNGGCVFLESASMTMSGGTITGGKASSKGGGMILNGSASLNMTGGTITGNTSTNASYAGGVHVNTTGSTFTVSGNAKVAGNTNASGISNTYLITDEMVVVGANGLSADASIGITMQTAGKFSAAAASNAACFTSDKTAYVVTGEADGLYLQTPDPISHCLCGDTTSTGNPCAEAGHVSVQWTPWTGSGLPTAGGYYYLPGDLNVTAQGSVTSGNHVVLDLHGNTITQTAANTRLFQLNQASAQLTVTDSVGGGQLIPVSDTANNKFGMIVDMTNSTAVFNLYGGTLNAAGKTSKYGVAINNWNGTVNMYGGTVTGGTSTTGGGGGNVMVYNGTFNLHGGTIENGTSQITSAGYGGGNIRVGTNGSFRMYGGTVQNGTAVRDGGNIYCGGTMVMTGGTVTGGVANQGAGGGIYFCGSSLTMSGTPRVTGNTVSDVYMIAGKYITLGADGLEGNASIGVLTPAGEGTFTTAANAAAANAAYFFSNYGSYAANVGPNGLRFGGGNGYRIGYGCVDITPDDSDIGSLGLMGYGTEATRKYMSRDAYSFTASCIAVTDNEGDTVLLFTVDSASVSASVCQEIKAGIARITGVYPENVMISSVHQHSTPVIEGNYKTLLIQRMAQAAQAALEDRAPAQLYTNSIEVVDEYGKNVVNFVRNYELLDADGNKVGMLTNNHDERSVVDYVTFDHESTADATLQLLKIVRTGKADVIMANFQVHPLRAGSSSSTVVTADLVGVFRDTLADALQCNVMYFSGAGGNIDPTSRISSENATANYIAQGQLLAQYAIQAENSYTLGSTGDVAVLTQTVTCNARTNQDEGLSAEAIAAAVSIANGETAYNAAAHMPLGIYSVYHANRIAERKDWAADQTRDITISTYSIGGVAFVAAPYEMFDTNGDQIKNGYNGIENPYDMTFIATMANGGDGYIPSALGYANGGYSTDITRYAAGTGETLVETFLAMLNTMKNG